MDIEEESALYGRYQLMSSRAHVSNVMMDAGVGYQ